MRRKWLIALIIGGVLIPLVAVASFRGKLLKMGIDSDYTNITITGTLTAGKHVVAGVSAETAGTGDVIAADDVHCGDDLAVTGLATIGETLTVTGNQASSGSLTVTGAIAGRSSLDITSTTTLAGVLNVTGTTTLTGQLDANSTCALSVLGEHKARILAFSGDKTLTAAMSGAIICNLDSSSTNTYTLPTAAAGLTYTFADVVATANVDLEIQAATGDKINGGTAGKQYECKTDSVGQSVTIVAIDATDWVVIAEKGTWANDNS